MRLIFSTGHDPYHNLAYEYELLEKAASTGQSYLFLYRNHPCIVVGRFQNPWREICFSKLPSTIKFVRRHSGGGTVYHDLGNWNFSFVCPGQQIEEARNLDLMISVLKKFDIEARRNERFDLIVDGDKISGSAFRKVKGATLHHGTLLVRADLAALKGALGQEKCLTISGQGVKSVPSSIVNLSQYCKDLEWSHFLESLGENLREDPHPWSPEELESLGQEKSCELSSWSWLWSQGPSSQITYQHDLMEGSSLKLTLEKGAIVEVESQVSFLDQAQNIALKSHLIGRSVKTEGLALNILGSDNSSRVLLDRINKVFFI